MLVEVLSSGNRKQLVILTKNGKRFSRLVDCFFVRAPLLRIDIVFCEDFRFNLRVFTFIMNSILKISKNDECRIIEIFKSNF